jgi:hypothetical protein
VCDPGEDKNTDGDCDALDCLGPELGRSTCYWLDCFEDPDSGDYTTECICDEGDYVAGIDGMGPYIYCCTP